MQRILILGLFLTSTLCVWGQEIILSEVSEGVYVHTSSKVLEAGPFPSNGMLIETNSSIVVIDTPWDISQTNQLLKWIRENLKKPVSHCIITHSHDDRVAGIGTMKNLGVRILGIQRTANKLKDSNYPQPDIILPEDTLLNIDGISLHIYYPGQGHSSDNIVVWLSHERILFGGCFVKSTEASGLGNIVDADLSLWPESLEKVRKKFKPAIIVPGHQGWESDQSLKHTITLLKQKGK